MTRIDAHLDAMLRHLVAAYYESLHGRAARTDVARALDMVEEHLNEPSSHPGHARPRPADGGPSSDECAERDLRPECPGRFTGTL